MKKALLILAFIVTLLVCIAFLVMQQTKKPTEVFDAPPTSSGFVATSTEINNNLFPAGGNTSTTSSETVNPSLPNFLQNNDVTSDNSNAGNYYLGNRFPQNQTDPNPDYVVLYSENSQFFNITLLSEPLSYARSQAEIYLKSVLKLPDSEMCKLKYSLAVPDAVNQKYSGIDLKFSFCPGSIALN